MMKGVTRDWGKGIGRRRAGEYTHPSGDRGRQECLPHHEPIGMATPVMTVERMVKLPRAEWGQCTAVGWSVTIGLIKGEDLGRGSVVLQENPGDQFPGRYWGGGGDDLTTDGESGSSQSDEPGVGESFTRWEMAFRASLRHQSRVADG